MAQILNGVLFNQEKKDEVFLFVVTWMGLGNMNVKQVRYRKTGDILSHLYLKPKRVALIEVQHGESVENAWGERSEVNLINSYQVYIFIVVGSSNIPLQNRVAIDNNKILCTSEIQKRGFEFFTRKNTLRYICLYWLNITWCIQYQNITSTTLWTIFKIALKKINHEKEFTLLFNSQEEPM